MRAAPPVIELGANQPQGRFYEGGAKIAAFRGVGLAQPHTPEDWIASVTSLFGETEAGLTVLDDGVTLAEAVRCDPLAWLGPDHVSTFGADPCLLVKLLDAGQRLPVHAHPDGAFADTMLGLTHGKTEAWVFIEPAEVHLGFARDVGEDELRRWVREQDVGEMLGAMHVLEARAGDAILVPAGLPHAIGAGALIIELQEPTDLSILMEWKDFAIDGAVLGHVGLGFDVALLAVDRRGLPAAEVASLRTATDDTVGELLGPASAFFRAERCRSESWWGAGYSVVVCLSGEAVLVSARGDTLTLRPGMTVLTPHAAGGWNVEPSADFDAVRCRPPLPWALTGHQRRDLLRDNSVA